jgi:hypothetical protein
MAWTGLRVLLCASAAAALVGLPAAGGDDPERRQKNLLAVQVALEKGQEFLQRGDYAAAVAVLEKQIPYIDGNRRYLAALADAYRGHVRRLEQDGRHAEARKYRGFLDILDRPGRGGASAQAPVKPAPVAGPTARGKALDDGDPFAESNGAARRARGLLERAERAFQDGGYDAAGRLYAQAERAEPGCAAGCQERWAYCKLYVVAEALNRPGAGGAPAELEREVRQALRMAPRLERVGQGLIDRLKSGDRGRQAEPAIEVKHTPRQGGGWAVAETRSFRIFHAGGQETAEKVARVAETTRVAMTRKWFGEEPRYPWKPQCDVYLHPTGQGYAKATGAPPTAPGHSTISLDAGRVVSRRIDLRGDDPNLLVGVLPHETTHVVLAGNFGSHHVPRWADEGMAVLSEPRERVELHLRNLPGHRRDGALFSAGELMKMADYPEARRIGPFYAQSVSLVDFLCRKKDPATFTRFLREALDGRYEAALERHYGYHSFAELEREWKDSALGDGSVATVSEKRRR